jgi:hypothetical protein
MQTGDFSEGSQLCAKHVTQVFFSTNITVCLLVYLAVLLSTEQIMKNLLRSE